MASQRAVFYDVDGTLVAGTAVHPLAWYAAHQAIPTRSLARTAALLARIPLYWAVDQASRALFNTLFYREYRGMTKHRLLTLADEMFAAMIRPKIYPGTADLVARFRAQGFLQVLVTGALDFTVAPLAAHLGIEHVIANRLVFARGVATGALAVPLVAAAHKVACMRAFARDHGVDLAAAFAYADSYADVPMLRAVGHPAAVQPDWRLALLARANRWPMIR